MAPDKNNSKVITESAKDGGPPASYPVDEAAPKILSDKELSILKKCEQILIKNNLFSNSIKDIIVKNGR